MNQEYIYLGIEDFDVELRTLTKKDITKLVRVCHYYKNKYDLDIEAEDIYQEALTKIYEGERQLPRDIPIVITIAKIIGSVANNFVKAKSFQQKQQDFSLSGSEEHIFTSINSTPSVEQELLDEEQKAISKKRLSSLLDSFENDQNVLKLIRAIIHESKKKDIVKKVFDDNETQYDTTRRRLMRRILKLQIQGEKQ